MDGRRQWLSSRLLLLYIFAVLVYLCLSMSKTLAIYTEHRIKSANKSKNSEVYDGHGQKNILPTEWRKFVTLAWHGITLWFSKNQCRRFLSHLNTGFRLAFYSLCSSAASILFIARRTEFDLQNNFADFFSLFHIHWMSTTHTFVLSNLLFLVVVLTRYKYLINTKGKPLNLNLIETLFRWPFNVVIREF